MNQNKIIVHEADSNIRDILRYVLEEAGYDAILVSDCNNIVGLISNFKPDVLVLDYIVSGIQSISTCREVKARFPHLPVIALSCNPRISELYKNGGFDDFITKPFDLDHFYDILKKYTHLPKNASQAMELEQH